MKPGSDSLRLCGSAFEHCALWSRSLVLPVGLLAETIEVRWAVGGFGMVLVLLSVVAL